jgi:hypothetical protein
MFSATFYKILSFYGTQLFPGKANFLASFKLLAENSAIWQQ